MQHAAVALSAGLYAPITLLSWCKVQLWTSVGLPSLCVFRLSPHPARTLTSCVSVGVELRRLGGLL